MENNHSRYRKFVVNENQWRAKGKRERKRE